MKYSIFYEKTPVIPSLIFYHSSHLSEFAREYIQRVQKKIQRINKGGSSIFFFSQTTVCDLKHFDMLFFFCFIQEHLEVYLN